LTRPAYRLQPVGYGRSWWARIENRQRYERRKALDFYYRRRDELIVELGGKCSICGVVEKLEIHRIDLSRLSSQFKISKFITGQKKHWKIIKRECALYCEPHAAEKMRVERRKAMKHGCWHSVYKLKCHCSKCEVYRRDYSAKRREDRRRKRFNDDNDLGVTAFGLMRSYD